jgi:hypothetical protein
LQLRTGSFNGFVGLPTLDPFDHPVFRGGATQLRSCIRAQRLAQTAQFSKTNIMT